MADNEDGETNEDITKSEISSCFMHFDGVVESLSKVSPKRIKKFITCRSKWAELQCQQGEIARQSFNLFSDECVNSYIEEHQNNFDLKWFHHAKCYKKFCDEEKIRRQHNKQKTQEQESCCSTQTEKEVETKARKLTRLSLLSPASGESNKAVPQQRSKHVLPERCIICRRTTPWFMKNKRDAKRVRQPLVTCETVNAGLLRDAAEQKNDEKILVEIRGRDCVAIEVRYHKICYTNYTKFLTRKDNDNPESMPKYQLSYDIFFQKVIEHDLLKNKQVKYMKELLKNFIVIVKDTEGEDASNYRASKLKKRLQKKFPQLVFFTPKVRNMSEMVYVEDLAAGDLLEENMTMRETEMTDDSDDSDANVDNADRGNGAASTTGFFVNELQTLYNAALIIRKKLKDSPKLNLPWPPLASDIMFDNAKKVVPSELFNMLSWICGFSEEAVLSNYVPIKKKQSTKIMSIAQDLVFAASGGKKPTPKKNCFWNGTSADDSILPPGFQRNVETVLAWDNDDFSEETISGKGTTHITGRIIIQRMQPVPSESSYCERKSLPKSRSLQAPPVDIEPYFLGKRKTVKFFNAAENISLELEEKSHTHGQLKAKKQDLAFTLCKLQSNIPELALPNWTGFNTRLEDDKKTLPPQSKVGYLPVIDASPTEFSTVNEILKRSEAIADKLELKYVCLVFDEAIYSKVQQIRWKEERYLSRFVVRLGHFHMVMSFCGAISKFFKDAGLKDILIESEIVAAGSINGILPGKHYNRSVRSHKVVYEALLRLLFQRYLESLPNDHKEKVVALIEKLAAEFPTAKYCLLVDSDDFGKLWKDLFIFADSQASKYPTFALWMTYIEIVQILLLFLRATRSNDWDLHLSAVRSMLPWFFVTDRVHYSRYGTAYWLEMSCIEQTNPGQHNTQQTHNRDSKVRGGLVGFTLNRAAVHRWIMAQGERGAMKRQCLAMAGLASDGRSRKDLDKTQAKYHENEVNSVLEIISCMTNPFGIQEESMLNIASGVVATPAICKDMLTAKEIGETKCKAFINDQLLTESPDLFAPIKAAKLKTFSTINTVSKVLTSKGQVVELKSDIKFVPRLLAIANTRDIDMENLMTYSLRKYPSPFATVNGQMIKTPKSKLLNILEERAENPVVDNFPPGNALMIDRMAIIQTMKNVPETFGSFADSLFQTIISLAAACNSSRVDFVVDTYPDISIENLERNKRAAGGATVIKIMGPNQKVPRQFKKFLSNGKNKESLIEFFFQNLKQINNLHEKLKNLSVFVTHGKHCHQIYANIRGEIQIEECLELFSDHEEPKIHASLYFQTGVGNKRRILDIDSIYNSLGPALCSALISFHAFTGCDSTSAFHGKGKLKPLKTLEKCPDCLAVFGSIGSSYCVSEEEFNMIENSHATSMACIWKRALEQVIEAPDINEYGWSVVDGQVGIVWMTIPPAPEGILENVNCGCQSGCTTRRCACKRAELKCTSLCHCCNCTNANESESDTEEEYQETEESLADDGFNYND
eukprot:gene765-55_t